MTFHHYHARCRQAAASDLVGTLRAEHPPPHAHVGRNAKRGCDAPGPLADASAHAHCIACKSLAGRLCVCVCVGQPGLLRASGDLSVCVGGWSHPGSCGHRALAPPAEVAACIAARQFDGFSCEQMAVMRIIHT